MGKVLKHLLLVTTEDAFNPRAWSGTPFGLRVALEGRLERVTVFQPPPPKRAPIDVVKRVLFGAKKFPLWITRATLKQTARAVQAEIDRARPDAVLSISSQCVAYLDNPGVPTFMFSDAPYLAFCETYRRWETPPLRIAQFAEEEARAARRLDGLCFGSRWACDEAQRIYGMDQATATEKLHITPLGATWIPALERDQIYARIEQRIERRIERRIKIGNECEQERAGELTLLFVGKDWERKGGPLAVEVAAAIRAAGHRVRLHVVGCQPELGEASGPNGFVTVHGTLYQTDPEQSARLAELFVDAHFLIVPTLAECYGIVFAEAQAFGLPPVSRAIDAVPTIVADGLTGLLCAPDAPATVYAERILSVMADPQTYRSMARAGRRRFEDELTWNHTAERIVAAIEAV